MTLVRIDLDIDSTNSKGFDLPARSDYEDQIEDAAEKADKPGKFIQTHDADRDSDGIPDFADGFDRDGEAGSPDDKIDSPDARFVPIVLEIPAPLWDLADFEANATLAFTYSASDPAAVCYDPESGTYTPAQGKLRLWTKDASAARKKASVAAPEPGHFIPPDTPLKLSALGLASGTTTVTLYVEALEPSAAWGDARIAVALDPDGAGPMTLVCRDAVRATLIRLEFVVPAEYDEATGLPKPDAAPVPTDLIGVSDPRPTVTLDPVDSSSVLTFYGHAEITLSGIVKDPIADNVPRGKVSEGKADIDSVQVYVDGVAQGGPIPVASGDDAGSGFWRQHPYKGTFPATVVNVPLTEGTHVVRVETSKNAAGLTGYDEVAVTLSKRVIPVDLEGQDPPPPPPVSDVIVDDGDPGFSVVSGSWASDSEPGTQYKTTVRYKEAASGSGKCRWTPTLPVAGLWEVLVSKGPGPLGGRKV